MKNVDGNSGGIPLLLDSCEGEENCPSKLSFGQPAVSWKIPSHDPWGIPPRRSAHRRHRRDKDAKKEPSLVLGMAKARGVSDDKQPRNDRSGSTAISAAEQSFTSHWILTYCTRLNKFEVYLETEWKVVSFSNVRNLTWEKMSICNTTCSWWNLNDWSSFFKGNYSVGCVYINRYVHFSCLWCMYLKGLFSGSQCLSTLLRLTFTRQYKTSSGKCR